MDVLAQFYFDWIVLHLGANCQICCDEHFKNIVDVIDVWV